MKSLSKGKTWLFAIGQFGWALLSGLIGSWLVYFYQPEQASIDGFSHNISRSSCTLSFKLASFIFFESFTACLVKTTCHIYQSSFFTLFSSGSFIPAVIESFIPGIEVRYSVCCIAFQSSSDIKTALLLLPEIITGSCDAFVSSMRLYRSARAALAVRTAIILPLIDNVRYFVRTVKFLNEIYFILSGIPPLPFSLHDHY